ncbi:PTS mannitol transporter subunit IICB [Oceanivirga salmonicida]|uniref:PTS mannitol transporter subunit IICB n=1 Tax=Oceanivirga salmonicida TaxID=1769291 RepID=UPI000829BF16|nr:PTS mannitol transporter subunit IICB [Oceanivirga salmonicida]
MTKTNVKVVVQKIGTALSSMVMPNIGAFIAWGLITALFIPTGWLPNAELSKMVGPMIQYLLPLLIAYTAGKNIHDSRGAVIATIATMGVVTGTDAVMFLGAMIMGPLSAYLMKKFDEIVQPNIKPGFEMLVNNFSLGILGFILAILGFFSVGPAVASLNQTLSLGVDIIINAHLLPLANVFIEPAKILFLNNAINHGILTPLGTEEARVTGKSILFLLEANPGVGLGILMAYMFYGKGVSKSSAYGAAVIHFLGGIHEIYFPYILMKPILIIAAILGGICGTATIHILGGGLQAPASPGSIIAILGLTARGSHLAVISGVIVATVASFVFAALILKKDKSNNLDLEQAKTEVSEMKKTSKGEIIDHSKKISKIIFACDAGMGSSAMGASILRNKIKEAGLSYEVINTAIRNLKDESNVIIISQKELMERVKKMNPSAIYVSVDNFLTSNKYDEIISKLK